VVKISSVIGAIVSFNLEEVPDVVQERSRDQ
jgi:hypothetical protein